MKRALLVILLCFGLSAGALAQDDLVSNLQSMLAENAELYLSPFAEAFGANLNSGLHYQARPHKLLGVSVTGKAMLAMVPEEATSFNFVLSENTMEFDLGNLVSGSGVSVDPVELSFADIYQGADTETATIFGTDGGVLEVADAHLVSLFTQHLLDQGVPSLVVDAAATDIASFVADIDDFVLPPGLGEAFGTEEGDVFLPMFMPQVALGLPFGIELSARGLPPVELEDVGELSLFGLGARVNVDRFIPIPMFPVDITASAFYHQFAVGDLIEANNINVGLQAGKSFNLLILGIGAYVDAGYQSSSLSISYEFDLDETDNVPGEEISFDFATDPGLYFGAGAHLKLFGLLMANVGLSQTPTNTVYNVGLGLAFR